jgi:hypothetical protein
LIATGAGIIYFLSLQVAKIDSLALQWQAMERELHALSESSEDVGRDLATLMGHNGSRDQQIEALQRELAMVQGSNAEQLRDLAARITDLANRMNRVEVNLKVNDLLATEEIEGAMIETPDGVKTYEREELDDFRKDANEWLDRGMEMKLTMGRWWGSGRPCSGPPGGCAEIGFLEPSAPDRLAARVKIHLRHDEEDTESQEMRLASLRYNCSELSLSR